MHINNCNIFHNQVWTWLGLFCGGRNFAVSMECNMNDKWISQVTIDDTLVAASGIWTYQCNSHRWHTWLWRPDTLVPAAGLVSYVWRRSTRNWATNSPKLVYPQPKLGIHPHQTTGNWPWMGHTTSQSSSALRLSPSPRRSTSLRLFAWDVMGKARLSAYCS